MTREGGNVDDERRSPTPEELLADAGAKMGLDALTFDESGDCDLRIEGNLGVTLRKTGEGLLLFSQVAAFYPEQEERVCREVARANYFWAATGGATLGVNDLDRSVILAERLVAEMTSRERFAEALDRFLGVASFWQERFAQGLVVPEETEESSPGVSLSPSQRA